MACYYCRYYKEPPRKKPDKALSAVTRVAQEIGQCTLRPTWEEVTGLHYCSHLSLKDASLVGHLWTNMHHTSAELNIEWKRRIALEKKLKELRRVKK